MDEVDKILAKIGGVEKTQFRERWDRMDKDFDLWKLKTTQSNLHETDVDVISNNPRTFADRVQATLSNAEMQIAVRMAEAEGKDKSKEIGKLERLLQFSLDMADRRLIRQLLPPLREQLIWFSIVRGWVAGRFVVEEDGDNVIFNFNAWDPRWLIFEVGSDGLMWAAYKTFRSSAAIRDEYGGDAIKGDARSNIVYDYWEYTGENKVDNTVFTGIKQLREPATLEIPTIPILIMPVATRPPVVSGITTTGSTPSGGETVVSATSSTDWAEGETEGYGDSIFAANRGVYKRENEMASMWATHANLLSKQPTINYFDDDGEELKSTAYLRDLVLNLPMNHNKLEETPLKEISPTLINLVAWMGAQRERGSLPDIQIGTPPPSGTLYNLIQEASSKVYNPHIKNLNYFYADICRLVEEQLIAGGIDVKVKTEAKRKYFEARVKPVDLKKPHIIKVEFTAKTPWSQLDTAQVADMLKRSGIPDKWIWEHIYKFPDPNLIEDLAVLETYEHSPQGMMKRIVEVLADRGYKLEAEKMAEEMDREERVSEMGATPEGEPAPPVVTE